MNEDELKFELQLICESIQDLFEHVKKHPELKCTDPDLMWEPMARGFGGLFELLSDRIRDET